MKFRVSLNQKLPNIMKHILYTGIFILLLSTGGCHQKKFAQQADLAKKAQMEAIKAKEMAEKSRLVALRNEQRARAALAEAERARQVAEVAKQQAILQQKRCEEVNHRLQIKLKELQKKK